MKKYPILFLFVVCSLFSCRKYEDGPVVTFLTKTERLTNDWILDVAVEEFGSSKFNVTERYPETRFRFRKDTAIIIFSPIVEKLYGTWELTESKEALTWVVDHDPITEINDDSYTDMTYDSLERFDIRKLSKEELWLVDKFNNVLRFVPE